MIVKAQLVLAFTDDPQGGNPAGVVLNDMDLSEAEMQKIASELAYSETAFVKKENDGFRIEFYTPNRRISNCGHATVATFSYLKSLGIIGDGKVLSKNDFGTSEVIVSGQRAALTHTTYSHSLAVNCNELLKTLGTTSENLYDAKSLFFASTGHRFLMAHLKDENSLAALKPDLDALYTLSEKEKLVGAYAFCLKQENARPEVIGTARMFAPYYGITEESATGMAAAPLAFYLRKEFTKRDSFIIFQGDLMQPAPRHSEISCEFNSQGHLLVGGAAVVVESREISIR